MCLPEMSSYLCADDSAGKLLFLNQLFTEIKYNKWNMKKTMMFLVSGQNVLQERGLTIFPLHVIKC